MFLLFQPEKHIPLGRCIRHAIVDDAAEVIAPRRGGEIGVGLQRPAGDGWRPRDDGLIADLRDGEQRRAGRLRRVPFRLVADRWRAPAATQHPPGCVESGCVWRSYWFVALVDLLNSKTSFPGSMLCAGWFRCPADWSQVWQIFRNGLDGIGRAGQRVAPDECAIRVKRDNGRRRRTGNPEETRLLGSGMMNASQQSQPDDQRVN